MHSVTLLNSVIKVNVVVSIQFQHRELFENQKQLIAQSPLGVPIAVGFIAVLSTAAAASGTPY